LNGLITTSKLKSFWKSFARDVLAGLKARINKIDKEDICLLDFSNMYTNISYYHRIVVAQIVGVFICIPLDLEPIVPCEDEVQVASRLIEKIIKKYPKGFDVVTVDSLYLRASFVKLIKSHGKKLYA